MVSAQELTIALGGRWHGGYGSCRCPAHEDRNPSLTVRDGRSGAPLLWCQTGCESEAVIDALKSRGLWEGKGSDYQPPDPAELRRKAEEEAERNRKRQEHARELWRNAVPIGGTLAERYLMGRGLKGPFPPTLRYLSNAKHGPTGLILPAMVAAVTRDPHREIWGLHRTFLKADGSGKANVSEPKMMLGNCRSASVHLAPAAEHIAVTEGIETGLSVQQEASLPVWAALSTSGLAALRLPDIVKQVTIFADNDANGAGERAAHEAMRRWLNEGRLVKAVMPKIPGQDFNDLLKGAA